MLNIQTLWQEIQAQEPSAYLVCASTCQVFIADQCISDNPSITTAIEQAWLRVCTPQPPNTTEHTVPV